MSPWEKATKYGEVGLLGPSGMPKWEMSENIGWPASFLTLSGLRLAKM